MADRVYEFVIIGGSIGGFGTAHTLLKRTIPLALKASPGLKYRVTLIATSTDFYWSIGSPRSIINDTLIPNDKMFANIPASFLQYGEQFRFVHGKATALSVEDKTVSLEEYEGDANAVKGQTTLAYDTLVVASGTRSNSSLWKVGDGSKQTQLNALADIRAKLPTFKSIVIGGGGPVGVESAGEIAYEFGKNAEITLVTPTPVVLPGLRQDVGRTAEKILKEYGVKVIHNAKVVSAETVGEQTTVTLSDGQTIVVDKYIDATGIHPNSSFIPPHLLDSAGYLTVNSNLFVPSIPNIYAVGDIIASSKRTAVEIGRQIPVVASNILFDITTGKAGKKIEYSPMGVPMMMVPIGRKKGAGILIWFNVFSWFVQMVKGKTYLIEVFEKAKTGAAY